MKPPKTVTVTINFIGPNIAKDYNYWEYSGVKIYNDTTNTLIHSQTGYISNYYNSNIIIKNVTANSTLRLTCEKIYFGDDKGEDICEPYGYAFPDREIVFTIGTSNHKEICWFEADTNQVIVYPDKPEINYLLNIILGVGVDRIVVNGVTYYDTDSKIITAGTQINYTAYAKPGYTMNRGYIGSFIMNSDSCIEVSATKDEVQITYYTVTWSIDNGCESVTINGTKYTSKTGSIELAEGTYFIFYVTVKDGYTGSGDLLNYGWNIDQDEAIVVTSKKNEVEVTYYTFSWSIDSGVSKITVNGTNFTSSGSISVPNGYTVSYSVSYKTNYSPRTDSDSTSGSFTMYSNESISIITEYYESTKYYTLSWTVPSNALSVTIDGNTYTSNGSDSFAEGTVVSCSVNPKTGYNGEGSTNITMNSNKSYSPSNPTIKTFTVSWSIDSTIAYLHVNGMKYTSSGSITVNYGSNVTLTASPASGYELSDDTVQFTNITSNKSCSFSASIIQYTFSWNLGEGIKSITVGYTTYTSSGSKKFNAGSTVSYTVYCQTGYTIDGESSYSDSFIIQGNGGQSFSAEKLPTTGEIEVELENCSIQFNSKTYVTSFSESGLAPGNYSYTVTSSLGYYFNSAKTQTTQTGTITVVAGECLNYSFSAPYIKKS